jgi:hypothetical protein
LGVIEEIPNSYQALSSPRFMTSIKQKIQSGIELNHDEIISIVSDLLSKNSEKENKPKPQAKKNKKKKRKTKKRNETLIIYTPMGGQPPRRRRN